MARDSQGNYSLPVGYQGVAGNTIQVSQHNPPLEDLAASMTGSLPRDGSAPMSGPLKVQPGSASSPSISPSNNSAIGFWFDSAGVHVAGTLVGTRYIGELIPWTLLAAPALCVLPYGQTLLRSSYPALWTVAQSEIAAGNTFYNNGDGSTTFGIGDVRGRVWAGKDDMGGTAANRLTNAGGGIVGTTMGAVSSQQSAALVTGNLPPYTPSGSIANGAITINVTATGAGGVNANGAILRGAAGNQWGGGGFGVADVTIGATASQAASTFNGAAQGGTSAPFAIVQPTIVGNFALYTGN